MRLRSHGKFYLGTVYHGDGHRARHSGGREDWKLELEDQPHLAFGAELIGAEIASADGVTANANRPSRMKGQVGSAAELVRKSMLRTCGRLRCEVRIAYQRVSPELDSPARGPANSRTAITRDEPGTSSGLSAMCRVKRALDAEQVIKVIHHAVIESIGVLGNVRQFVETEERITKISLPRISLKYACYVLRW